MKVRIKSKMVEVFAHYIHAPYMRPAMLAQIENASLAKVQQPAQEPAQYDDLALSKASSQLVWAGTDVRGARITRACGGSSEERWPRQWQHLVIDLSWG
jgi:hypothetical protein